MNTGIEGTKLPPLSQIGIVVKDAEAAAEYYQRVLGIGPWEIRVSSYPDMILRGKPSPCKARLAFAQSGPVQLELIQILEGETTHTEFLRDKGEGLHHLGFDVGDIEERIAKLDKLGVGILMTSRTDRSGFAYMETESTGGVIMELIQRVSKPQ